MNTIYLTKLCGEIIYLTLQKKISFTRIFMRENTICIATTFNNALEYQFSRSLKTIVTFFPHPHIQNSFSSQKKWI